MSFTLSGTVSSDPSTGIVAKFTAKFFLNGQACTFTGNLDTPQPAFCSTKNGVMIYHDDPRGHQFTGSANFEGTAGGGVFSIVLDNGVIMAGAVTGGNPTDKISGSGQMGH